MERHTIADIIGGTGLEDDPSLESLWGEGYKIPWNDPDFSRRMLDNHLTQDHDLASRRDTTIAAQVKRLHDVVLRRCPSRILDLGCGPGLYAPYFTKFDHSYRGIDFGPASIEYAEREFGGSAGCSFFRGDVRDAEFGAGYDMVMMLYGELNVFSPDICGRVLKKSFDALKTGGRGVFEVQAWDTVKAVGHGENSWYAASSGLFSEQPHLCLTESRWLEGPAVAVQYFRVIDAESGGVETYRSTTKAWSAGELYDLMRTAGFESVMVDEEWPNPVGGTMLISGEKG